MAGTDPRFPSARFQEGILFAQNMALAPDEIDQPLFFFADTIAYEVADTAGHPWVFVDDPVANGDAQPYPPVLAICGIKVIEEAADESPVGERTPLRLKLSFMPSEWAKVAAYGGFKFVKVGQLAYSRGRTYPPRGLFDVEKRIVEVFTGDV